MTDPILTGPIVTGPIAYLAGEYPRATDTFIQREIAALRRLGATVHTCSIRRTGPEHHVGEEQRNEARDTFNVIAAAKSPGHFLRCHWAAIKSGPGRYFRALGLALKIRPPGLKAFLYQLFYFAEAAVLADHLQKNGVVHLHNHIATASCTVAMLASALSGIPYSFTLHGPGIFYEPMHWRIDEKIARASFVACISEFCRSQAMNFSARANWSKLHIVHCGVEPDRYTPKPDRKPAQNLTFVGRLAAVKGVPVLFDALTQIGLPDIRLTLVGDGPERAELEREARAKGLSDRLSFVGYKSQSEVAEILQDTDILVLPSFAEGVPVVLMEAMAAEIPVITTRVAGIPELVEDGVSGALVAPGDELALAQAITTLLADPGLRTKMGKAGRAKVSAEFNLESEASWLAQLFAAYLSRGSRPTKRPNTGAP